ncbi:MAG: single-stranded DNA-binding protein [Bacteroidetes bacterium HGW-Bacteroidetes-1]|jgi:single-strand DNA-binding protein|nr:MAG: single-stranded DNA-binding protein [Bacteroidetes bacterium HGW-Bacteroidetes-1]
MAGLNKVMLIGRLGKDPDVISFENGGKKMTVSLATSERYRDREGNWQDQTEWHNIVAWGNLASDIAEKRRNYVKGDLLFVEGKIKTRQYADSQGVNKYITEIVAEKMNLISKGGGGTPSGNDQRFDRQQNTDTKTSPEEIYPSGMDHEVEDLPF